MIKVVDHLGRPLQNGLNERRASKIMAWNAYLDSADQAQQQALQQSRTTSSPRGAFKIPPPAPVSERSKEDLREQGAYSAFQTKLPALHQRTRRRQAAVSHLPHDKGSSSRRAALLNLQATVQRQRRHAVHGLRGTGPSYVPPVHVHYALPSLHQSGREGLLTGSQTERSSRDAFGQSSREHAEAAQQEPSRSGPASIASSPEPRTHSSTAEAELRAHGCTTEEIAAVLEGIAGKLEAAVEDRPLQRNMEGRDHSDALGRQGSQTERSSWGQPVLDSAVRRPYCAPITCGSQEPHKPSMPGASAYVSNFHSMRRHQINSLRTRGWPWQRQAARQAAANNEHNFLSRRVQNSQPEEINP